MKDEQNVWDQKDMNINIFLGYWVDALADIQISRESSPSRVNDGSNDEQ